jgi:hypothetical protein
LLEHSVATRNDPSTVRCDHRLAVESQEVVPVEARTADRWSMVEATMRAVPVVVVKPGKKMFLAVL